ncbi:MAG: lysophospholipid acyltransferase family protein [Planctomycetota bacterium]
MKIASAALSSPPPGPTFAFARAAGRRFALLPSNRSRLARAQEHLGVAFPDLDVDARRELAIAAYQHLFVLAAEIARCPRTLNVDSLLGHVELCDVAKGLRTIVGGRPCIVMTGHCGNWEVLASTSGLLGLPLHAVYRPLDLKPLDRWVRETRSRPGLTLVDKFGAVTQMPSLVADGACPAFVADQNAGDRGLFVPYFGRLASSYKSIGLLAMQFQAQLVVGAAYRLPCVDGTLRYRFRIFDTYGPEDWNTHPDPLFYLTARYRRALEMAVRDAPEQYLWMHRIWKSRPRHERLGRPFPDRLRENMRLLPWMSEDDIARTEELSGRDAATLAERGVTKLA